MRRQQIKTNKQPSSEQTNRKAVYCARWGEPEGRTRNMDLSLSCLLAGHCHSGWCHSVQTGQCVRHSLSMNQILLESSFPAFSGEYYFILITDGNWDNKNISWPWAWWGRQRNDEVNPTHNILFGNHMYTSEQFK